MRHRADTISLNLHLDMTFFSVTMSFVEETAMAFGMNKDDVLGLRLACEEIFTYLLDTNQQGGGLRLEATNGLYYVGLKFFLETEKDKLFGFNRTLESSEHGETDLSEMGLIIASRSVSTLRLIHDAREGFGVEIIKEKTYPEAPEPLAVSVIPLTTFSVKKPDSEVLKLFVRRVTSTYPQYLYPTAFLYPGKVADMVASGCYRALVASDSMTGAAGGLFWHATGIGTIEFFGPYLFNQPAEYGMAESLLDHLLAAVAKTGAICLINPYATPELPANYLEPLGAIERINSEGSTQKWPFYFRLLNEDAGAEVWANPVLNEFMKQEYTKLSLARRIIITSHGGEERPRHAVISPRFDRTQRVVTFKAIWDGKDISAVIGKHMSVLKREGFSAILFELDCAYAWQANLSPVLLEHGFTPRMIIPYGGDGDLVIFQYAGESL